MILYSEETDLIYDTEIHNAVPVDAVEIDTQEKHEHMGNITYEGKQRVKHVYPFVFEDTPFVEVTTEQKTAAIESERDKLLKGTDWYVVRKFERDIDTPVEVSEYRAALATIDELEGYPDIDLPDKPFNIKFVY